MLNIDLCERLLKCREMQDPQQREACERKIGELLGDYFRPYPQQEKKDDSNSV